MKWLAIHLAVVMTLLAGQVQAADSSPSEAVSPEQALLDVQKKAREAPDPSMDEDERQEIARLQLMTEAGRNYGVQMGRYNRWLAQVEFLNQQSMKLDQGFPFGRLYLRSGTLQPPILDSAEDYRAIEDDALCPRTTGHWFRLDSVTAHCPGVTFSCPTTQAVRRSRAKPCYLAAPKKQNSGKKPCAMVGAKAGLWLSTSSI